MENVLVVGATGTTGRKVVQFLMASQNFEPVAMVRKEAQIQSFADQGVQTRMGDLETDIPNIAQDMDKVVFAAGSGGKKVLEVDQEGAKKVVDSSKKHNLKKFVMLSSLGADAPEEADELQAYLEAKHRADEYLKQSGIAYTIVRPGALTNAPGKGSIELKEQLGHRGSVPRTDVAQVLTRSLHDHTATNKTVEIISGNTLIGKAMKALDDREP
ncbi:SDR family oxidoreductase [Maribacter sp. 2307ULW6-5]|uniref:SDR family oxidoreductase n=1 Tax=Maribacter sp. 2307ULW6-5 TaxID=3386275 RepID=UPI0039BC28FA